MSVCVCVCVCVCASLPHIDPPPFSPTHRLNLCNNHLQLIPQSGLTLLENLTELNLSGNRLTSTEGLGVLVRSLCVFVFVFVFVFVSSCVFMCRCVSLHVCLYVSMFISLTLLSLHAGGPSRPKPRQQSSAEREPGPALVHAAEAPVASEQ